MKKLSVLAAVALFMGGAALVSAKGFTFSGNIRSGISVPTKSQTFDNDLFLPGDNFGGGSRIRMNLGWDADFGGAMIRYQAAGALTDDIYFKSSNIKYAMAYANFFQDKIIVEGGHLFDRFTTTGGYEDGTFGDDLGAGLGARLVLNPVDGLYLAASATDVYARNYYGVEENATTEGSGDRKVQKGDVKAGKLKADEKLFGFSAKYSTDEFFLTAGAHLAKVFYGSVGFTGVEGLTVAFEAFADYRDVYAYGTISNTPFSSTNEHPYDLTNFITEGYTDRNRIKGKYTDNVLLVPYIDYTGYDKLDVGAWAYIWAADDAWFRYNDHYFAEVVPYVSYEVNDVVTLRCEANIFIPKKWDEDDVYYEGLKDSTGKDVLYGDRLDGYTVVVPSIAFTAGQAEVDIYAQISSDTDQAQHKIGAGVKYNF